MRRSGWSWRGCWRSAAAWRPRSGTWRRCRRGRGRTAGALRRRPGTRTRAGCRNAGSYAWTGKDLRDELPALAAAWLPGDEDDLAGPGLAIDETAHLKAGDFTARVAPQHAGCTGKVENCVTWVFSAYVTSRGQAWADFDVYMPERWAQDTARRQQAGIPEDLEFATKPDSAIVKVTCSTKDSR